MFRTKRSKPYKEDNIFRAWRSEPYIENNMFRTKRSETLIDSYEALGNFGSNFLLSNMFLKCVLIVSCRSRDRFLFVSELFP